MTQPSDLRTISQSDIDNFATQLEAVKTTLAGYIQELLANQAGPVANEGGLQQALSDLSSLEPPAPTPGS